VLTASRSMRTPLIIASVALLSCTESSSRDLHMDDAAPVTFRPSSMDASPRPADLFPPELRPTHCDAPAGDPLPASPTNFRVELRETECFGFCPDYSMTVDQDGRVTYYGRTYVARFGPHEKQVPPADARAIYDALYQAGYGKLNRCYRDTVDGCRLSTDSPWSYWNVSADGAARGVDRYHGCQHPSPELSQVDATARLVLEKAGLSAWVRAPQPPLPGPGPLKTTSYRLSHAGRSLGTLIVRSSAGPTPPADASVGRGGDRWELVDCAKVPQASGSVSARSQSHVLLAGESHFEPNPPRVIREELPIALPSLGEVGSILIDAPMPGRPLTARAQRGDEDIPLELVADQPGC